MLCCNAVFRSGKDGCRCNNRPVKFESGAWFLRQAQRALSLMPWSFSTDRLEQIDVSMFERHHVALRDTLAALTTALRDALKRKLTPGMLCGRHS
ncbi:jg10986 [Pararge aegeria aegeria]|uniref:Jg10986 protein n=1 Tax=Pararge aegeria aegeria TaxID=348720 RepID=A0A8S4SH65_9NEOP|nr:jg10986 [Pararge aegeria aegeria]